MPRLCKSVVYVRLRYVPSERPYVHSEIPFFRRSIPGKGVLLHFVFVLFVLLVRELGPAAIGLADSQAEGFHR